MTASATLTMPTNDITLAGLFEFLQQNMVTKQELRDTEKNLRKEMIQQKEEILTTVDQKLNDFKEEILTTVHQKLDSLKEEILTIVDQKLDDLKDEIITMTGEMIVHTEKNLRERIDHFTRFHETIDQEMLELRKKHDRFDARLTIVERKVASAT